MHDLFNKGSEEEFRLAMLNFQKYPLTVKEDLIFGFKKEADLIDLAIRASNRIHCKKILDQILKNL